MQHHSSSTSSTNNPYLERRPQSAPKMASQPLDASRDEVLSDLERCCSSTCSDDASLRLLAMLQRGGPPSDEIPWTLSQVLRFVSWILSGTTATNHSASVRHRPTHATPPQTDTATGTVLSTTDRTISATSHHNLPAAASLFALASVLPSWSDLFIYAALSIANKANEAAGQTATTLLPLLYDTIRMCDASFVECNNRCRETETTASLSPQVLGALSALAALWQTLDRLQSHCELSSFVSLPKQVRENDAVVWWLQPPPTCNSETASSALVRAALSGLVLRQDQWQRMTTKNRVGDLGLCDLKTSCVSVLIQLLRLSQTEWLYADHGVFVQKDEWTRRLWQESSRLNDVHMPSSTYTIFSLRCLELMVLLVHHGAPSSMLNETMVDEVQRLLQTTGIVSHVITAAFGIYQTQHQDEETRPPRWTQSSTTFTLLPQSLAVIRTLYHAGAVSMSDTLARHACTVTFLEGTWNALVTCGLDGTSKRGQQTVSNDHLDGLLLLHSTCRVVTRNALLAIFDKQTVSRELACSLLIQTLVDWMCRHSSLPASALLQHLLIDRLDPLRHDELSRHFWPSSDAADSMTDRDNLLVEQCMDLVAELGSSSSHLSLVDYRRPVLLSLLDSVYVLFVGDNRYAQHALSVQSVEALIQIMSPKRVRIHVHNNSTMDLNQTHDSTGDSGTPTAHNLSRIDTSMLFEEEETPPARGWDPSIRLAAATLLAVLANCQGHEPDSDVVVLRGRIQSAVHSFVDDGRLVLGSSTLAIENEARHSAVLSSLDTARRRLRLLVAFHAPDNEEDMAGLIHNVDMVRQQSTSSLLSNLNHCQEAIEAFRIKEKKREADHRATALRTTTQAVAFDRQSNSWKRLVERQAKDLAEIHSNERQKAETRAAQLARQLADAENSARDVRELEQQARASLVSLTTQLNELSAREQVLVERAERSEREAQQLAEDLRMAKLQWHGAQTREKELKDQTSEQADLIEQLEQSESELRDSLESLFGDMVSLAQLYIAKEKEEKASRESFESRLEKTTQRLEAERQRNAKLEERDKRNQYEVEVLTKNYARAREKLDKEREERRKEADQRRIRAGPISYINQLHTSATTDDRDSSRKGSTSGSSKENRASASSSFASSLSKPPSSR